MNMILLRNATSGENQEVNGMKLSSPVYDVRTQPVSHNFYRSSGHFIRYLSMIAHLRKKNNQAIMWVIATVLGIKPTEPKL